MARAPDLHSGGQGFDSLILHQAKNAATHGAVMQKQSRKAEPRKPEGRTLKAKQGKAMKQSRKAEQGKAAAAVNH